MLRGAVALVMMATPVMAEYRLEITDTGKRDYYCTITVALTNESAEPLTEINAFFLNYIGDTQVGRSKGASFFNVAPGASARATFETPNAPCGEVERYDMVIGACRLGASFTDKAICAGRMALTAPFGDATPLD
ncbi:hypothetical protein So717_21550 [Roseobacter cerasinus]|uniref:Uncharacterized protein n=2 Tax=Roseobacter cerasinus TaxID=2602289 RepID=A0A640VRU7_9RHOB|nr:hypothetical protein So717_21550 [Roseobacter cerasinus]